MIFKYLLILYFSPSPASINASRRVFLCPTPKGARHGTTRLVRQFGDVPHSQLHERPRGVPAGGYYYNQHGSDGHATAVYNPDGTLADVAANRDWVDVPRQDQD